MDAGACPLRNTPPANEDMLFSMVDRRTMEFIQELATILGMTERWVIDHIVATYAATWGFEPPEAPRSGSNTSAQIDDFR
jgi:hypothetical protein